MSSDLIKTAYDAGCVAALTQLFGKSAAEDATEHPPDDASAALPIGGGNRDAKDFAQFAQNDTTEEVLSGKPSALAAVDKPVHWSGATSLDGGDAGTRTMNMGLPRFGGV